MTMPIRTKIVCTIGPSVHSEEAIRDLILAGMNVARINFSHGTLEEHKETIDMLKRVRLRMQVPLAIMLDTKGLEIRVGQIAENEAILLPDDELWILREAVEGSVKRISITPPQVLDQVFVGSQILFDNGYISSRVLQVAPEGVLVRIENGGTLKGKKGVNIPNVKLNLPSMTDNDERDLAFGCEQDVDIVAASFMRTASDVLAIKTFLAEHGKSDILVMAKIENAEGVANFDSIIQVADGVMIARGDLGVEVPISQVPRLQKMMIRKSYLAGKPSVTATQMLESMMVNPRPTRAEVSDIANAILDSTSAVMLSGETAVGRYPVESVRVMHSVIHETEVDFSHSNFLHHYGQAVYHDVPSAVSMSAVKTGYSSNAKAIFAFTKGGGTARLLSRMRPSMPIIAMTPNRKTYHQLASEWGVTPFYSDTPKGIDEAFKVISQFAMVQGLVAMGDLVVVTAGTPFGVSGTTNMMLVESIGDVLVRGHSGVGARVYGNVGLLQTSEARELFMLRGHIVVVKVCDASYEPFIKGSAGIVLANHPEDDASEHILLQLAEKWNKPVLLRATSAFEILKEGQLVTLDPTKALVYKGVVL